MKKKLSLILALLFLVPSLAIAADMVDVGNIKFGGEVQMRGYEMNNFWTFDDNSRNWDYYYGPTASERPSAVDDDWSVFRIKASLFASAEVGENITGYIRLTNQNYGEGVGIGDNVDNKVFVENAFIDVKSFWGLPVTLRFGRQNMMYGSGFVMFDGQSQFASTSMYFDGVKGTYNFTDNVMLDLFYMIDQENNRGNHYYSGRGGDGDDIYVYGAYLTASDWSIIGGKQEVYAMSKKDENYDRDIKLFGVRLSDKFDLGVDYSIEVAKQRGTSYGAVGVYEVDHDAWGGKVDLGYTFGALDIKPRIFGQLAYMSGDDEDTEECEQWDVFYGGWPQFGDLLAWKFVNVPFNNNAEYDRYWNEFSSVSGEATYSNMRIMTVGVNAVFGSVTPKLSYSKIRLDETYGWGYSDSDDFGDYYQGSMGYQYSKALSFGIYYGVIMPGDAFVGSDDAYEFYWETKLKF